MDKQRREAREAVKNLPFKEKIKHFWYYYKTHTICIAFAVILIVTTTVQCMRQTKYDMNIAYYSVRHVEKPQLDALTDLLETVAEDTNENGSVDVFISFLSGDITTELLDQYAQMGLQKMQVEVATDEYQSFILDRAYLDTMERLYSDVIGSVLKISDVPKIKEAIGLPDGEELYLVTTKMFDRAKDDDTKVKEHKNAVVIKEYFEGKIK
ncbi:MAG: hypothetical protein IKB32_04365 [Clostridia bacterium]|nr:hypothetical protein [Clostridia bacterium]